MRLAEWLKWTISDFRIDNPRLKSQIVRVLERIPDRYVEDFPDFSIYPGSRFGGHVEADNVFFDADEIFRIAGDDEDAIIGLIAHELAHKYLDHATRPDDGHGGLTHEDEADNLASGWGFSKEIRALRRRIGPATPEPPLPLL